MTEHHERWRQRLGELAERFRVPGAVLGIARGDELVELSYGVTNIDTGVEVAPDTLDCYRRGRSPRCRPSR